MDDKEQIKCCNFSLEFIEKIAKKSIACSLVGQEETLKLKIAALHIINNSAQKSITALQNEVKTDVE